MTDSEKKIRIDWFDDDFDDQKNSRVRLPMALKHQANEEIEVFTHTPEEIDSWIEELRNDHSMLPDILLIDLRLKSSQKGEKKTPAPYDSGHKLGSALQFSPAASTPKYLLSYAFNETQVGMQPDPFDWVLDQNSLANSGRQLLHDGKDYRSVRECIESASRKNTDSGGEIAAFGTGICSLLKIPCSEEETISELVCDALIRVKREYSDIDSLKTEAEFLPFVSLNIGKWIRSVLLRRNGPLIDNLLAATLLGVKEEYFSENLIPEYAQDLEPLKYSGLFSFTEKTRWWRSSLLEWAVRKYPEVNIGTPKQMAREFSEALHVPPESVSICAVCGEKWPDTIARDSEVLEDIHMRQVHRGCGRAMKGVPPAPGFDELREFETE